MVTKSVACGAVTLAALNTLVVVTSRVVIVVEVVSKLVEPGSLLFEDLISLMKSYLRQ